MKSNDHPEVLFNQIEVIRGEYSLKRCTVDEDDLISAVIAAAPKGMYGNALAGMLSKPNLTVADLQSTMDETHRVWMIGGGIKSMKSDGGDHDPAETSLINTEKGVRCWYCKEIGHTRKIVPS